MKFTKTTATTLAIGLAILARDCEAILRPAPGAVADVAAAGGSIIGARDRR
jgi:CBS-domain-containing membrane protein